mmetsp:Transcript_20201/g.34074  ORF Transcript_20201/g.34074 Transcript_20201/m.34074 type:complete len:438 (-) Transcript_20201:303-1616(-)
MHTILRRTHKLTIVLLNYKMSTFVCQRQLSGRTAHEECASLLHEIYGPVCSDDFPKSLSPSEAGPSTFPDRRYLWTDAFGILNFVSLALTEKDFSESASGDCSDKVEKPPSKYSTGAQKLIDAVVNTLGQPRSDSYPMERQKSGDGYKGLRIGKVKARKHSDYGMEYDGMYWHYLDKFIFALLRYSRMTGEEKALHQAVTLIKDLHPAFFVPNQGYHWKLNCDLTRIVADSEVYPSHDVVSAWVVFNIAKCMGGDVASEVEDLKPIIVRYFEQPLWVLTTGLSDPLGLGTHLWTLQWLLHAGSQPTVRGDESGEPRSSVVCCGVDISAYVQEVSRTAARMLNIAATDSSGHFKALPFRYYGMLLGAQLSEDGRVRAMAARCAHTAAEEARQELHAQEERKMCRAAVHDEDGLKSINTVMLAAAILPTAWQRLENESW